MANQKKFHAVADDTALVANISEIKRWVAKGDLTLTIPVYTLDRLHVLKRDSSQIGINAREALKFLDRVTSGKDDLPESGIQLQGPDDQFSTWEEVEAQVEGHRDIVKTQYDTTDETNGTQLADGSMKQSAENATNVPSSTSALSQMLLNKLNFSKEPEVASNASTPPTSPSSSNLHSTKTSPEVLNSRPVGSESQKDIVSTDAVIIPHGYRPLVNSAVFMLKPRMAESSTVMEFCMLTNDPDLAAITRKFGLAVKNIHQLRSAISSETQELKNQSKYQQKHSPKPSLSISEPKEKTLFSYENEDEDDEVVFRPRSSRGVAAARGRSAGNKLNTGHKRSAEANIIPPPIPTEEIDPDSFDRGAFARARPSTPNGPSEVKEQTWQVGRGSIRGGIAYSPGRGSTRGNARGLGRGSARGKGKLFVP